MYNQPNATLFQIFFPFHFLVIFCAEDYHVLCHTIGFFFALLALPPRFVVSILYHGWMG